MSLPHRFPIRLIDRLDGRAAVARLSTDAYWMRGGLGAPLPLFVEAAAQASALLLESSGGTPARMALAGIERAELSRLPTAGETLEFEARVERRLGDVVRVRAWASISGERVGEAILTLVRGS